MNNSKFENSPLLTANDEQQEPLSPEFNFPDINSAMNDIKDKRQKMKNKKKKKTKHMSRMETLRMGPIQKCLKRGKIPVKLILHVTLVILIFLQVFLATVHRSSFVFHSTKALADRFLPEGYTSLQDQIDGFISADITTIDGFFADLKKTITEYYSFVESSTSIYFYFPKDSSKNYEYQGKRFNDFRIAQFGDSSKTGFFNKISSKKQAVQEKPKKQNKTTKNITNNQKINSISEKSLARQQKERELPSKLEPEPLLMDCDLYPTNIRDILDTRNKSVFQFWPEHVFHAWPLENIKDYFVFNATLEDSTMFKEWWSSPEKIRAFFDRVSSCKLYFQFQQLDLSEFSILDDQTSNSINLLFSNFMVPILRFFRIYEFIGYTIGEWFLFPFFTNFFTNFFTICTRFFNSLQWNIHKHYNFETRGGVIKLQFRYFFSWCTNILNIFHDFIIIQLFKPIFWVSFLITILSIWSFLLNLKAVIDRLSIYAAFQEQVLNKKPENGPGKGIINECTHCMTHKCLCFPFCVFNPWAFFKQSKRSSKHHIFTFVIIHFYELPSIFSTWVIITFISDISNIISSVLCMLQIGFSMEISFFMGLSALFAYFNIIRYLQFAPKFYVLLNALQKGFPAVIRFCISALPLFFGFAIMGTLLFGDYSDYFNTFDQSCVSLFALMNGDSVHAIFDV